MVISKQFSRFTAIIALGALTACGGLNSGSIGSGGGSGSIGSGGGSSAGSAGGNQTNQSGVRQEDERGRAGRGGARRSTIWDLFSNQDDPNVTLDVNKYIWNASLEVLNFLPVQTADPFSGIISTGYGSAPGSRQVYRATIYIVDPALDARSLNISMQTRSGASVDADTVRAIEDAILTRARQLRIRDDSL